jgi:hypothetical protein
MLPYQKSLAFTSINADHGRCLDLSISNDVMLGHCGILESGKWEAGKFYGALRGISL